MATATATAATKTESHLASRRRTVMGASRCKSTFHYYFRFCHFSRADDHLFASKPYGIWMWLFFSSFSHDSQAELKICADRQQNKKKLGKENDHALKKLGGVERKNKWNLKPSAGINGKSITIQFDIAQIYLLKQIEFRLTIHRESSCHWVGIDDCDGNGGGSVCQSDAVVSTHRPNREPTDRLYLWYKI